ncbi:MAG: type IV pilus assembly protein PilC [Candidatus Omnitrophota bacterium]
MPKFSITVKSQDGKTIKNIAESESKEKLIAFLQKQGYFIVNITELDSDDKFPTQEKPKKAIKKVQTRKVPLNKPKKFARKKAKLEDLLALSRQLATMLEAGVSLVRSLNVIQSQAISKEMSEALLSIRNNVERGSTLSQAIAKHPKIFDQFWISLIEVGEASGTIPTVLHKLSFYMQQQASFQSTIVSGVVYPAVLFVVCMGAVAFFALFVGPRFEAIFNSMDAELPWITSTLLDIFRFIKEKILLLIGGIFAAVFLLKRYLKTYSGKSSFERILFKLPQIGEVYKLIIVERFSSQMAILIDAGVPILYALDITERLVNNNTCAEIVNNIKEDVKQGHLIVTPMEKSNFFPPMALQMITVGEETGELSKMLKHVAEYYQDLVETYIHRAATLIEPLMLVFMGVLIGTIVTAMFLPMFNLSQLG